MSNLLNILKGIAVIIPISGALFYFFGILFDEGYYVFLRLDSTLFQSSIHETIVRGVLGIVQIAAADFAFIILVPLGALDLILLLNRPLIWVENKLIKSSSAKTPSDKINQLHGLHTVLAS